MTTKSKIIRTIYLYVAALVSLIFVAVGTGTILNTVLKAYVFPKAEKGGFSRCNGQPPVYALDKNALAGAATTDQKVQLDNLLRDYEQWKKDNTGEECYSQERQSNVVDAITMIMIALPICLFHWRLIKKDKGEKEAESSVV
ncbi:MAG: hypothetical protein V1804_03750 [Patescibacteria group bacterium]